MDKITKDEFNNLTIEKQVEYVNHKSLEKSLTKVCDEIGINRSTIRKRFDKNSYIFDPDKKIYITNTDNNKISNMNNNENNQPKNPLLKKSYGSINAEYIFGLEGQILDLKDKYDNIIELIKTSINKNTTNTTNNSDVKFTIFEGEVVNRAYKIDRDVQQEFKAYCKRNSEYRVSDILSTILKEYMEKNK